jgi:hypothetical protein
VIAAVLGAVNDHTQVHPYGDGVLVDLPLTYGDGDGVRVLVEPMGTGVRVSDRAAATVLLSMADVEITSGRPAEAFADILRSAGLNSVYAEEGEITTFGAAEDLGDLILRVAQAAVRVDQLRWLAQPRHNVRFDSRVAYRLQAWAGSKRKAQRGAAITLKSGRTRAVTASVTNGTDTVWVQALGESDKDRSFDHCYSIFGLAPNIPHDRKIATLAGSQRAWPSQMVSELSDVADVQFFEEATRLERALDQRVPLDSPPQLRASR